MSLAFESVYARLYQPNPDCHFHPRSRPVYHARPSVTTGADDNTDGITSDRPPGVSRNTGADTPLGPVDAYRAAHGLAPVKSLTSPSLSQLDLRIYRPFVVRRGKGHGTAFVQIFNVLNRYNGGLVEGRVLASNFGAIISNAGPPRSFELGFKMGF